MIFEQVGIFKNNYRHIVDIMDVLDTKAVFPEELSEVGIKIGMTFLVHKLQKKFCEEMQKLEHSMEFTTSQWSNSKGAKGITQILENGNVFEKVAVCTSIAEGALPKSTYLLLKRRYRNENFPNQPVYFTAGVNGVAYPKNPHVPTLNFSYRYFEIQDGDEIIWWFGGGSDLTPYILHEEDCLHFHKVLKICCDQFDKKYYLSFKKTCDDYFYLEHRGERRGVGGIFFSELNTPNLEACFQFVSRCLRSIIPSYLPIVIKNKDKRYSAKNKDFQLLQRGRYVEFCFICDKATRFVLLTPGVEYENILISLPPSAKWQYSYIPEENSKESLLLNVLKNPREWIEVSYC